MANFQHNERPDLEDLVAYIEGRGSESLRAQVLQRLDEDEAYLQLMVDLVPMLRDDEEAAAAPDAPPEVVASPPPVPGGVIVGSPSRFRQTSVLLAAMAAFLSISVGVWLWSQANLRTSFKLARMLSGTALDKNPWEDVDRGLHKTGARLLTEATPAELALAGSHILDLEVAILQRDRNRASKILQDLNKTSSEWSAVFGSVADALEKSTIDWTQIENDLEEGHSWLREVAASKELRYLELGTCLRGAWFATKANNVDFFANSAARSRCLDVVGADAWTADTEVLKERFDKIMDESSDAR